jgi:hypothetical protein
LLRIVASDRTYYALGVDVSGRSVVLRSTDGGVSWVSDTLALTQVFDLAVANGELVIVGRSDAAAVTIVGVPSRGWRELLVVPDERGTTRLEVVAARSTRVAVGGRQGDRPILFVGDRREVRSLELWSSGAVTGLAFQEDRLLVTGFEGTRVELGRASAGEVPPGGTLRSIKVAPGLVQIISIVCRDARACLAIAPTGSGDRIVRLTPDGWRPDDHDASFPTAALERVIAGPASMYAVGSQHLVWSDR